VRRNPPYGKGTSHIRRITPRTTGSGEHKSGEFARLIRPTDLIVPYAINLIK